MKAHWRNAAWLIMLVFVACAERNAGIVETVTVTPDGIGRGGTSIGMNLTGATPLTISNAVENRVNGRIVVTVVALVVDPDGRVHLRRTLADGQVLAAGATETFVSTLPGPWELGMVLGIWTDVETDAGPRAVGGCTPLCQQCDQTLIQRACEQLELLSRRERKLGNASELGRLAGSGG